MAHVAGRVLAGEVPHRDFDDPWTGLWSLFQAGIFRVIGPSLAALRVPIFAAWLAGLAAVFGIARRFSGPLGAASVTLVSAIWSLYAWHLPLLNWYYLPLAAGSALAVVRHVESDRRRWLWIAGFGAGISIGLKVTGLFLLAALLLWAMARAADEGRARAGAEPASPAFGIIAFALAGVYSLLVFALVRRLPVHESAMLHVALPNAAVALCAARWAWRGRLSARAGLIALVRVAGPVIGGAAIAILPIVAWFASHGALHDLAVGVFVRPTLRLTQVWMPPPGRVATIGMLAAPLLLLLGSRVARVGRVGASTAVAVALGSLLGLFARRTPQAVDMASMAIRAMPIVLSIVALWWIVPGLGDTRRRSMALLLVASSATGQLLQVPFANFPYFLYVAPLMMLAAVALLSGRPETAPPTSAFGAAFLVVLGLGHPAADGLLEPPERWAALPSPRAGINVSPRDSAQVDAVARFVDGRPPGPLFVVRDAPQYYFLLDRPNATRVVYDIVADSASRDAAATLGRLDRTGTMTILLVRSDLDEDATLHALFAALQRAFPNSRKFGGVDVRWRDRVEAPSTASGSGNQQH